MTTNNRRIFRVLGPALSLAIFVLALRFLHGELADLSISAIWTEFKSLPALRVGAAIALTTTGYLVLTGYDAAALAYIGRRLPFRKYGVIAFMADAVGHNVGLATFSGGSVRFRMYSGQGLGGTEITRLVLFVSLTFALGASGLLGAALIAMPPAELPSLHLPPWALRLAGCALLALPVAYLLAVTLRRQPLNFGNWRLELPSPRIALGQIVLSAGDILCAAGTLYVLLEPSLDIGFFAFLGIYLVALATGLVSSIPGGIGVFEAILIAALPMETNQTLLGVILAYRLIYFLLPLGIAMLLLVAHEIREHRAAIGSSSARIGSWLSTIAPELIGIAVFLAGTVLLVSGASPAAASRLELIEQALPLALLEISHLAGSLLGLFLLVLARGLFGRLRNAYVAAMFALALGMLASIAKGLDYEEALFLGAVMIALWSARAEFHRVGKVSAQAISPQWTASMLVVLGIVAWVVLVSYRHVPYSQQLWWQFEFDADAPRSLRAGLAAIVAAFAFGTWQLMSRSGPRRIRPTDPGTESDSVHRALATAQRAAANLALLGDKRFLFNADRSAFVMYRVSGQSWVAMGDPVGPESAHEGLLWDFRELVDRHSGRPVFYQVASDSLATYVDMGLSLAKLGEDARVPLEGFTLEGSRQAELRQAVNRMPRLGGSFELIPKENVPGILGQLRRVSDRWLADKGTAEKGFSLGAFTERYICEFDCAVVRAGSEIVAFANLWKAPAGGELSIDLMRYTQSAPKGVMDYLFTEIMRWAASREFRWFNLGMAPLSGMENRPLAPLWHKVGHLVFTHGDPFYNFEGLRAYKAKFHPEWHPRYLACPGGWLDLPWALLDVTRLVSGGVLRLVGH